MPLPLKRRFHPIQTIIEQTNRGIICASRDLDDHSKFKLVDRDVKRRRFMYGLFGVLIISSFIAVHPYGGRIFNRSLRGVNVSNGSAGVKTSVVAVNDSSLRSIGISSLGDSQDLVVPDDSRKQLPKIDPDSLQVINVEEVGEPFYNRWPLYDLPPFAIKETNYNTLRQDSICFVHVGKTAGSTVGCYLGFGHHCGNSTKLDGILPMITTHLFHDDVYNCYDDSGYFLFVLRDPVSRAQSAFYYNRPDEDCSDGAWEIYEKYYKNCPFWTFEAMIQNGLSSDGTASAECKTIAAEAMTGVAETITPLHLYYNYQYYFDAIPANSRILVVRSEHLLEDWNSLEKELGGKEYTLTPKDITTNNANIWLGPDDKLFSDESREIVCKHLCNEIKVYTKILRLAENLNKSQVEQSLGELKLKCPLEVADEYVCPEAMPDNTVKLKENRGPNDS